MKRKLEIEATLERSLREQVNVPRLDRSFDAGVWARIEAGQSPAATIVSRTAAAATSTTARWLFIVNAAGLASVAIFICVFGAQVLSGMDVSVSLPQASTAAAERIVAQMSTGIAVVAIAFGLMFTPWGRRVRSEFN